MWRSLVFIATTVTASSICACAFESSTPQVPLNAAVSQLGTYAVEPFKISLSAEAARLKAQVAEAFLPSSPISGADNDEWGMSLATLRNLRDEWLSFDWSREEEYLNSYRHYTTVIDGTTIHFVHEKSRHPNAIPVIINHGWPGSIDEYLPVVRPLLELTTVTLSDGSTKEISFDVVIPSLPGFVFSSTPPTAEGRHVKRTAAMWNTLMTNVLGYTHGYAVAGNDWGGNVAYATFDLNLSARAAYLNFFPFLPPLPAQVAADNQTLTDFERFGNERSAEWWDTGRGYHIEHTTRPNTIGLALNDNPIGLLAYMGEKFIAYTDPTGDMTHNDILRGVSLYYLTHTHHSAVFQYAYNQDGLEARPRKSNNPAPMGYANFKWDIASWPRYFAEQCGNLVWYRQHEKGGHFPGLDNPDDYVQDLREFFGKFFTFSSMVEFWIINSTKCVEA
ncbi:alpha/beta-hydrolase [Exidia glandulosa HHB12029]|uniref:Alpha/beta-hydrolase n=1 Tax=Exidia glandulosa HHB12029 TaxID=1314781 RepID=A0A165R3I9_EXIGL|nr:alpha/beta-hydrolase [Exidia glandulosa HHB12029]